MSPEETANQRREAGLHDAKRQPTADSEATTKLESEDWDAFCDALVNPPAANQKLQNALRTHSRLRRDPPEPD
jgi:uncharacterized protein (DUF1778 family)